ncbi:MAG TPA: amidase, partial [Streptosporangiaceae bacterium]|nr:amidase [Streptosporangiaceae bacterium]
QPPTAADLAPIAERYGLELTGADLAEIVPMVTSMLGAYDRVAELYAQRRPVPPSRDWQWPADGNELGAWYVRTAIEATSPDGPLAGRTVAIKDNICVAGVPMMNGSAALDGFVPSRDATVVTRVLDAGATITGKAVCEDLCFSGGSHTSRTGPVRNPWDPARTAGGSSSGSAALVAAGLADLAIGGDQAGSVRIPSSFCGVVGHKPTHGLVPYTGAFPIENTIDHLGPIARTVTDAALLLSVLAGPDGLDHRQLRVSEDPLDYFGALDAGLAGLRIGILEESFAMAGLSQPEVDEAVRAAAAALAGAGAEVRTVSIPWHREGLAIWTVLGTDGVVTQMIDGDGYGMNTRGRYDPELIEHYARGRRQHSAELPETVKVAALAGRYLIDRYHGTNYAMARNLALDLTAAYDAALAEFDVLVMPTLPIVASLIPPVGVGRLESVTRSTEMIVNTCPFDVTGHPAISVPAGLGRKTGLPVGLMIVGRRFDDAMCLRVARGYESVVGGFPAPPGF